MFDSEKNENIWDKCVKVFQMLREQNLEAITRTHPAARILHFTFQVHAGHHGTLRKTAKHLNSSGAQEVAWEVRRVMVSDLHSPEFYHVVVNSLFTFIIHFPLPSQLQTLKLAEACTYQVETISQSSLVLGTTLKLYSGQYLHVEALLVISKKCP